MKDWISLTKSVAMLSDYPKRGRRTGCIIKKSQRALSVGWNKHKNRIGVTVKDIMGISISPTDHAETDAMNKLEPQELYGSEVIVLRLNGGISMPCNRCLYNLIKAGVKSITWEGGDGRIRTRRINGKTDPQSFISLHS